MRAYDKSDLADPKTYESDPDLQSFCRSLVQTHFEKFHSGAGARARFREEIFAGEHAGFVHEHLQEAARKKSQADKETAELKDKAAGLSLPDGFTLEISDQDEILLRGPRNPDLNPRLKRQKGYWDAEKKAWVLPLAAAKSLQRIFSNAKKKAEDEAPARERAQIEKWLGFVEQKAPEGYLYARGMEELARLGIDQHPDLARRLDDAKALAARVGRDNEIRRWLGFVEEKAPDGYLYQKGIDTLERLKIQDYPEYATRLEAAKEQAREVARQKEAARQQKRAHRQLFPVTDGPPLNHPVRFQGRVLVFEGRGKTFPIDENHPSMFGSHLLGREGEAGCYYYFREASAEEVHELEAQEAATKDRAEKEQARRLEIEALRERIQHTGERPEGWHEPEGRRYLDIQTIYGGGDWFVIGENWIWYCRNNGMDGDNWSLNNVRTAGAGAIGWRVPYDADLVEKIEAASGETEQPGVFPT